MIFYKAIFSAAALKCNPATAASGCGQREVVAEKIKALAAAQLDFQPRPSIKFKYILIIYYSTFEFE